MTACLYRIYRAIIIPFYGRFREINESNISKVDINKIDINNINEIDI